MRRSESPEKDGAPKGTVVFDRNGNIGYFGGEQKALYSGNKNVVEKYICDISGKDRMPWLAESPGAKIADRANSKKQNKKIQAALYVLDMAPDIAAVLATLASSINSPENDPKYLLKQAIAVIGTYVLVYAASKVIGKEARKMRRNPGVFLAEDGKYRPATYEELNRVFPEKSFGEKFEELLSTSAPYRF